MQSQEALDIPESLEPLQALEPMDVFTPVGRRTTRRFGWAVFLWGSAVWPFYLIAAGLPLLELHSLLAIAAVVTYVLAGGRMILGIPLGTRRGGPVQAWIFAASVISVIAIVSEWETGAPVWLALSLIWPVASLLIRIEPGSWQPEEPMPVGNARFAYVLNIGLATWFAIWTFFFLRWTLVFPTAEEVASGGRDGVTGVVLIFIGWVLPIPVVIGSMYLSWSSGPVHRSLRFMAISNALIYLSLGAGSIAYVAITAWLTLRRFSGGRTVASRGE